MYFLCKRFGVFIGLLKIKFCCWFNRYKKKIRGNKRQVTISHLNEITLIFFGPSYASFVVPFINFIFPILFHHAIKIYMKKKTEEDFKTVLIHTTTEVVSQRIRCFDGQIGFMRLTRCWLRSMYIRFYCIVYMRQYK